jgi:hypothetical protein
MNRLPIELLSQGLLGDVVQPQVMAPPALQGQRDWRAKLFDHLVPQGNAHLEDADKSRMFRQGLLQLAAGL